MEQTERDLLDRIEAADLPASAKLVARLLSALERYGQEDGLVPGLTFHVDDWDAVLAWLAEGWRASAI